MTKTSSALFASMFFVLVSFLVSVRLSYTFLIGSVLFNKLLGSVFFYHMFTCLYVCMYICTYYVGSAARKVHRKTRKDKKTPKTQKSVDQAMVLSNQIAFASFFDFSGELAGLSPRESS